VERKLAAQKQLELDELTQKMLERAQDYVDDVLTE
jgi:hypothetical protein